MKKKLTLNIEELRVESFDADAGQPRRGTVLGRDDITEENGAAYCGSVASGCDTADGCCGAASIGDQCGTSSVCDDLSVCWGGNC